MICVHLQYPGRLKTCDISKKVISNFEAPDGTPEVFSISQHTVYKPFNGKVMGWFGTKKKVTVLVCPHLSGLKASPENSLRPRQLTRPFGSESALETCGKTGSFIVGCLIGDRAEGWRKKQPFTIIYTFQMMNLFLLREYITMYLSVFWSPIHWVETLGRWLKNTKAASLKWTMQRPKKSHSGPKELLL